MSVEYTRINWEDSPSTQTPLNAENLNAMDSAIDDLAGAVNDLDGVTGDIDDLESEIGAIKNDLSELEHTYSAFVVETETGSIASFSDGADNVPVKDLTVAIEPVQDLHGYDNPWPAGGGKNLTDYDTDLTSQAGINMEAIILFSVVLTAGKTYTISCKQSVAVPTSTRNTLAIKPSNGTYTYESTAENFNPANLRHTLTYTPQSTGQYEVAFWPHTPSVSATYNEWQVEESGSFTLYAPYSNICPISGWTGANVTRAGKNLYDLSKQVIANDNTFLIIDLKHNTDYVFSTNKQIAGLYINYSDNETCPDATGFWRELVHAYSTTSLAFNSGSHKWYKLTTYEGSIQDRTYQLEFGSTATAYEPYQGETYEVDWTTEAGTVYGGTLDVTTGVLTVDMFSVDLGSMQWYYASDPTYPYFRADLDTIMPNKRPASNGVPANMICTKYKTSDANSPYLGTVTNCVVAFAQNSNIGVYDTAYTDATAFKNASSGVMLCYELATPQTYQLTAQEVSTILGQNNIFADTGNVTVQYRADTKLYIDKVLSA